MLFLTGREYQLWENIPKQFCVPKNTFDRRRQGRHLQASSRHWGQCLWNWIVTSHVTSYVTSEWSFWFLLFQIIFNFNSFKLSQLSLRIIFSERCIFYSDTEVGLSSECFCPKKTPKHHKRQNVLFRNCFIISNININE